MLLHLFSLLVAASTALLIFAGGLVTSTGSGLSVPDWPSTYGWFMLTFPIDKWVGGIFYEHSHRLIASAVGFLIVVQAVWLWMAEPRHWVRRLGYIAVAAVTTQGILGGITVLWFLPAPISIAHASLAQLVFCLTVSIAVFTSPGWRRAYAARQAPLDTDRPLQTIAMLTTVFVYAQIVAGATMRHTGAGLAIPDFPLVFGSVVPPYWTWPIAIHYAHRIGALVVSACVLAAVGHVLYHHRDRPELRRPSLLLLGLLAIQITLGALTVLSGKQYLINSFHVVTGACVLGTSLVLTLRSCRPRFAASRTGATGSARLHESPRSYESTQEWSPTPGVPGARV
ncbi:MAG: COX15/CtaA family protein [Acidobacteria bacterium]|nr:COX15/CtaA family protein [Acidobacteriota bacterium]